MECRDRLFCCVPGGCTSLAAAHPITAAAEDPLTVGATLLRRRRRVPWWWPSPGHPISFAGGGASSCGACSASPGSIGSSDRKLVHKSCSCGIFTIKYMQYWNGRELALQFTQKNMETFRKKMAAELLVSPLNELVSIRDHVFSIQNFDWVEY